MSNPKWERWIRLVRVLLFMFLCAVILILASVVAKALPRVPPDLLVGGLAALATYVLTVLFLRWDRKRLHDVGLAPDSRSALRFLVGVLIGLVLVAAHMAIMSVAGHVRWVSTGPSDAGPIAMAALAYLLLACREEIAFRGYPLRRLAPVFGPWGAQCIVTAIFVGEHLLGGATWVNAVVGAGLGSLVFGMAALATRGLALPIGLHAAWNLGDWAHGGKGGGGLWSPVIDTAYESEASTVAMAGYAIVMLSALALFWMVERRTAQRVGRNRD